MYEASYLSKVNKKQLDTWSKTTDLLQRQASPTQPALRRSPTRTRKSSIPDSPKNTFIRKADYLINVSRDRSNYLGCSTGKEEKYSGSLYESCALNQNGEQPEESNIVDPKRDVKLFWAQLAETEFVPCVPDIFLKIACTDDNAPYGSRDAYITYAKVYDMGLRIDLRTVMSAMLIPTQFRLLIKESQKLRKFYHLVCYHTRTLIAYRTFRLFLLEAVHRRIIKKLQLSLGTLSDDDKGKFIKNKGKNKGKKDDSGKILEEYLLMSLSRQRGMMDKFFEIQNNDNIVSW